MAGGILSEDDDDLLDGEGGEGGESLTPIPAPTLRQPAERGDQPAQYDVVEVDDNGKPLGGQQRGEERLSEAEGGERPLLDQRQGERQQAHQPRSRAERRRAQKEGRDRTQQELAQTRRELDELRQQLGGFAPRFQQFDAAQRTAQIERLDGEIAAQAAIVRDSESKVADAIKRIALGEDNAATDLATAQRAAYTAIARGQSLTNQKAQFEATPPASTTTERAPAPTEQRQQPAGRQQTPLSPRAQQLRDDFAARHAWIDIQGRDVQSRLVIELDNQIIAEGYDPSTQDYWDELEDRIGENLPHRVQRAAAPANGQQLRAARPAPAPQRRGPAMGGGDERAPASGGRQTVYMTPGRKQALIDAGIVAADGTVVNAKRFENMKKQFAEYDRANGLDRRTG